MKLIDWEIAKSLAAAHARVLATPTERREPLDALARLLLKQEIVEPRELEQVLNPLDTGYAPTATPVRVQLESTLAVAAANVYSRQRQREHRNY